MGTDLRTAAQQALEALEICAVRQEHQWHGLQQVQIAKGSLRAALEQPEQEPVAWIQPDHLQKAKQAPFLCRVEPTQRWADFVPFYTHPPRREWRGLTEEDIWTLAANCLDSVLGRLHFARAIEAALKERNA